MEIKLDRVRLFYEKFGKGSPLILLHGNGESGEIFREATKLLAEEYAVYAIDSRCHGKSEDLGELSYKAMMEDTAAFIEALALERPAVCGFSDGGIVGILLALTYPQRLSKLIACGANLDPSGLKARYRILFRLLYWCKRDPKIGMMLGEPQISPQALEGLDLPVLLLAGERDMIRTKHTRLIHEHIPGSKLRILPGETHESYVVHSTRLAEEILPFLRQK